MTMWLSHRRLPVMVAAVGMALSLPSLWTWLAIDDYWHRVVFLGSPRFGHLVGSPLDMFRFVDGDPERLRQAVDAGLLPWWSSENLLLSFWRPVTAATHCLDYALWPDTPSLMSLQSMMWFGILVFLVARLYRRVMGTGWVAGLAALAYAIDDGHSLPVGWIANRNSLLGALFGVGTILLHDSWRKGNRRFAGLLATVCLGAGLLAKETAVATCGYLLAYALFIDRGSRRSRMLSLVPYVALVLVWRVGYQMAGYGARGSASYIDPLASPLRFLVAVVIRGPVLLLGQWAGPPPIAFVFAPLGWRIVMWATGAAFLAFLCVMLAPLLRSDAIARFWGLGMLLAAVPSCATIPSDRLLAFVGLGAMGLLARFITAHREGQYLDSSRARRACTRVLCWGLLVVHLCLAPALRPLRVWAFTALNRTMLRTIESARLDHTIAGQTLVAVNSPHFLSIYTVLLRDLNGQPTPQYIRSLSPAIFRPVRVRLTRTDERTLLARPRGGFRWLLFRDGSAPYALGDRVELAGMSVEVTRVARGGRPLEVAYRFGVPLEHDSLAWLQVKEGVYVPFTPPAVGENVEVAPW